MKYLRRIKWMIGGAVVLLLALFVLGRLILPTDEAKVRKVVEIASTSDDPAYCDALLTQRYLKQITGAHPPYADDICESEAARSAADGVDTSDITVDGDQATAVVSIRGGALDGSKLVLALVRKEGRWKLDHRAAVAHFDRARFIRAYRMALVERDTPSRAIRCAQDEVQKFSDSEIKAAILAGSYSGSAEIIVACDRPGVERHLAKAIADPATGLLPKDERCAKNQIETSTNAELVRLQLDVPVYVKLLLSCNPNALYEGQRRELTASDLGSDTNDCILRAFRKLTSDEAIRLSYDEDRYRVLIETCQQGRRAAS